VDTTLVSPTLTNSGAQPGNSLRMDTFDSDSNGWTLSSGVTWSGGKINATAANTMMNLNANLTAGAIYYVSFDYTMTSGKNLRVTNANNSGLSNLMFSQSLSSSGSVNGYFVAGNNTSLCIAADWAGFTGTIDNFRLYKVSGLATALARQPWLSGTGEAGATITFYDNGSATALGTTTVASSGLWSYQATTITSGNHSITYKQTDVAGNVSALSNPYVFAVTPVSSVTDATSASVTKDAITFTVTFDGAITGTVGLGTFIATNGTVTAVNRVGTSNAYTVAVTPTAGVASGYVTLSLVGTGLTDASGNAVAHAVLSDFRSQAIDTVAPTLTISSDKSQLLAGQTATITFTFSEDPGTTFTWDGSTGDVVVSGGTLGAISGSGLTRSATFTPTANLASGTASISVASGTYTDAALNSGGVGTTPRISINTLAVPTIDAVATDNIISLSEVNAGTLTVTGTCTSGASAVLVVLTNSSTGASVSKTATVSTTTWATSALTAADIAALGSTGNVVVTARQTVSGATSSAGSRSISIDTSFAPATAVAIASTLATDNIISGSETPTISGTATSGATVTVTLTNTATGASVTLTPVTATGGNWTTAALSAAQRSTLAGDGNSLLVSATQVISGASSTATKTISIDTVAPTAPGTPALVAASDTNVAGDNLTSATTPSFTGTADKGATVKLYKDGVFTGTSTTANASTGVWTIAASTLTAGTYNFTAKQTDSAGNEGAASGAVAVTVDTVVNSPAAQAQSMTVLNSSTLTINPTLISSLGNVNAITASILTTQASFTMLQAGTLTLGSGTVLPNTTFAGLIDTSVAGQITFWVAAFNGGHTKAAQIRLTDTGMGGYTAQLLQAKYYANADVRNGSVNFNDVSTGSLISSGTYYTVNAINMTVPNPSTQAGQPVLTGTGEAGATVTISDNGSAIGTALVKANGTWVFQATSILSGSHSITVTQKDVAGNAMASPSSAYTFTVNTGMSSPALVSASDSGAKGDTITNLITPTLTGVTATLNGQVEVYDGATKLGTTTANGQGVWTFASSTLTSAVHRISAKDVTTNTTSGALHLSIDTEAAAAPSIATPVASNVQRAPTLIGTGVEANATITLSARATDGSASQSFTATANASGAWAIDTANPPNAQTALAANKVWVFSATQTDAAGNTSVASAPQTVNFDTSAAAPTISNLADNATTNRQVTLSGTAEASNALGNVTVKVYDGSTVLGSTTTDFMGGWTFTTPALSTGAHTLKVEQLDAAGNLSAQLSKPITVDTTALGAPVLGGYDGLQISTAASTTNRLVASNISINAANGSAVSFWAKLDSSPGGVLSQLVGGNTGNDELWANGGSLILYSNGDKSVGYTVDTNWHQYVLSHDGAGNTQVFVDGVLYLTQTGGGGTTFTSATYGFGGPYWLGGRSINGAMRDIKVWDVSLSTPQVLALYQGQPTGQESQIKAAYALLGDTTATTGPTLTVNGTMTGVVSVNGRVADTGILGDNITSVTSPVLRGQAAANATLEVWDTVSGVSSFVKRVVADGTGAWSTTLSSQTEGVHNYLVRQLNADGTTTDSAATTLTIDTTAPSAPSAAVLAVASNSGSTSDTITNINKPTLSGTAASNAWVTVLQAGSAVGKVQAGTDGTWSFTVPRALADGSYSFTAKQEDTAGNLSADSSALSVTVDSVAAAPTVQTLPVVKAATLVLNTAAVISLSGSVSAITADALINNAVFSLSQSGFGVVSTSAKVIPNTTFAGLIDTSVAGQITFWVATVDGAYTKAAKIRLTDTVGGGYSATLLDSKFYTGAGIDGSVDFNGTNGVTSNSGTYTLSAINILVTNPITQSGQPVLTGSGEAGTTVTIYDNGSSIGTTLVKSDGTWSYQATTITNGNHSITTKQTDVAGNVSALSSPYVFSVDTTTLMGLPALLDASDTGAKGDGITKNTQVTLTGVAITKGGSVQVRDGSTLLGTVTSDTTTGVWTLANVTLASGVRSISATDVTATITSAAVSLTVDATLPAAPTLALGSWRGQCHQWHHPQRSPARLWGGDGHCRKWHHGHGDLHRQQQPHREQNPDRHRRCPSGDAERQRPWQRHQPVGRRLHHRDGGGHRRGRQQRQQHRHHPLCSGSHRPHRPHRHHPDPFGRQCGGQRPQQQQHRHGLGRQHHGGRGHRRAG
jgi:large repetitive protein